MPDLVDVHDKTELWPPGADTPVRIDVGLAEVMPHIWRLGFTTLLSCQDLGESIAAGGTTTTDPGHRRRGAVQWGGYAWLKMPLDTAKDFLSFAVRLPGLESPVKKGIPPGWEALTWLRPGGTASFGNVYIPAVSLPALAETLAAY